MSLSKSKAPPRLRVKVMSGSLVYAKMSDCWTFFADSGVVEEGSRQYRWMYDFTHYNPDFSVAHNLSSQWGKQILKLSHCHIVELLSIFIAHSSIYPLAAITLRRILPLQLKYRKHPHVSRRNLIRHRLPLQLKTSFSTPQPSIPPNKHKQFFHSICILPTTPIILPPPIQLPEGLSLPRRLPRAGVG